MDINRDVILDLLPLYLGGEASPASRALVDEYLRGDPELARQVREHAGTLPAAGGAIAPPPDTELRALRRTHRILAWQRWVFALGVACLAVSLSLRITFHAGGLPDIRLLMLDAPLPLGVTFAVGVTFLFVYRWLRRTTS